jgi:hypothetical protein
MDITTVAEDVLGLLAAEGIALSDNLTDIEPLVRDMVLRVGAKAVELKLAEKPLGYEGSSRACDNPGCKHDQKFVGHRPRKLTTLLGQVTFKRAYYHCKHCGCSCCPYDQRTGLGSEQMSVGLAKAATLLATLDPFIPAATILHELTGQRLGDRTVHQVARKVGKVACEREKQAALAMATWSVPVGGIEACPRRLYIAVDGVMVHRQQWNEAKCVACYWEEPVSGVSVKPACGELGEPDGKRGVERKTRYAVRFESAEPFKAFVWSLAMRCGLESAIEVVLLGDGAAWIWEQVAGVLGERTVCITDWYHVMEHIWACGRALHGAETAEAVAWVKQRETELWEGRYESLLKGLEEERRQSRSIPKRTALDELTTYLKNQGKRLAYDRFRAAGYDIGSGRVESACKHVVANRMKRSGMIWSDEGAQHLLSLRTCYLNGNWHRLWAQRPLHKSAA